MVARTKWGEGQVMRREKRATDDRPVRKGMTNTKVEY